MKPCPALFVSAPASNSGKTTVTERVLYYTGKEHSIGEVHDGISARASV